MTCSYVFLKWRSWHIYPDDVHQALSSKNITAAGVLRPAIENQTNLEGGVPGKSSGPNIKRITVNQLTDNSNNKIPDLRAIPTSMGLTPEDSAMKVQHFRELQ